MSGNPKALGCSPHFERMLYDQPQLARVYLHAWQITRQPFYRAIADEILDYVAQGMVQPQGGFYSTQDADTEGEEGQFFLWTPDEIRRVLGDDAQADAFMSAYGVTRHGNFEGRNILHFVGELELRPTLAQARRKLFEAREERIHPGRDGKILTVGWAMSPRTTADLTLAALKMAIQQRRSVAGLIHHSDQGGQYTDGEYQALLQAHGIQASMNGTGSWYDNSPMQSFFGSLKSELVHHRL